MGLRDTAVTQGGKYTDSPKKESLYYKGLVCGRGEIGKHKGLKIPRLHSLVGSSPTARTNKQRRRPGAGRVGQVAVYNCPRLYPPKPHPALNFSPAIPTAISPMQARRIVVTGSPNSMIPKNAAPRVPMPVQTA